MQRSAELGAQHARRHAADLVARNVDQGGEHDPQLEAVLRGNRLAALETDEGIRTIEGATREDTPRLVAEAVAAGRKVYGVRVLTSTLEDTYLEAVQGETS